MMVLAASQFTEGEGISCVPPSVSSRATPVHSPVQNTLVRCPFAALHIGSN